ncbi:hypothetical protein BDZ45DRAFT_737333 [Acephala macrosclerotiorum]|nr:hypothetical protein BDZ45DRAFT_737333 [Acephala macrosclerotiorum]
MIPGEAVVFTSVDAVVAMILGAVAVVFGVVLLFVKTFTAIIEYKYRSGNIEAINPSPHMKKSFTSPAFAHPVSYPPQRRSPDIKHPFVVLVHSTPSRQIYNVPEARSHLSTPDPSQSQIAASLNDPENAPLATPEKSGKSTTKYKDKKSNYSHAHSHSHRDRDEKSSRSHDNKAKKNESESKSKAERVKKEDGIRKLAKVTGFNYDGMRRIKKARNNLRVWESQP